MLSWNKLDRERHILNALSSTWGNLKKKKNKLIDTDWSLLKVGKMSEGHWKEKNYIKILKGYRARISYYGMNFF